MGVQVSSFVCPACKTPGRYGLQTRANGTRFWACNGSHRDPETERALRSCDWSCEELAGLEYGCLTVREVLMQVAHAASVLATNVGVRAQEPKRDLRKFLADGAEEFERLASVLRIVASYDLQQEQRAALLEAADEGRR